MKLEESHPADEDLDTGVFAAITDNFIAESEAQPPSLPPAADFTETEEYKALTKVQNETRQRLQNILFLTTPPKDE